MTLGEQLPVPANVFKLFVHYSRFMGVSLKMHLTSLADYSLLTHQETFIECLLWVSVISEYNSPSPSKNL